MIVYIKGAEYKVVSIGNRMYYENIYCQCGCGELIEFKKYHIGHQKVPKFASSSHSAAYILRNNPNYFAEIQKEREKLLDDEVLIKSKIYKVMEIDGKLYYKDKLCECGCKQPIPYLKTHSHNGVPRGVKGHIRKRKDLTNIINNLIEINGKFFYKDAYCQCGCGNRIPFNKYKTKPTKYIKRHCWKDPNFISKRKEIFNTDIARKENSERMKQFYVTKRLNEEQNGYIVIKKEKIPIQFVDGIKVYKDKLCKCGCGNFIPVKDSHINLGVPDYLYNHWNTGRKVKFVLEDGIKCYENSFCQCGCGKRIPLNGYRKSSKYIKGHKKALNRRKENEMYNLIEIEGIRYYREVYCECGCGNRLKFYSGHKYTGTPRHIRSHIKNDPLYLKELKERASKMFSQKGSYGRRGHYYSSKNDSVIAYDSIYELRAMEKLENDSNVLVYDRCKARIPYELDTSTHNYFPDFVVNTTESVTILEIKPEKFVNSTKNLLKFDAARDYCALNNIQFEVWTEKDLGITKHKNY